MHQNPAMLIPIIQIGNLICLGMHRNFLVEVDRVEAEDFVEPVEDIPLRAVFLPPSGLYGVLRVLLGAHLVIRGDYVDKGVPVGLNRFSDVGET